MTILDKAMNGGKREPAHKASTKAEGQVVSSEQPSINEVELQFKNIMSEFNANAGFSVNTGEQAVDTMVEVLSSKGVAVSIAILLSYIRHCINKGLKKDITVKIGYNKPPAVPMNFAVNEELLEDIYPGDVVEIN